jgi:hypothetical protein
MNSWPALDRFLQTDPRDAGCDKALELLHIYAEIVVADPRGAEQRYPEVAAHLRDCGPCAEDLEGLLAAISADPAGLWNASVNYPGDRQASRGAVPLGDASGDHVISS